MRIASNNSNRPFLLDGADYHLASIAVDANGGTATLQKLVGRDPDNDTWVDVEDGAFAADGEKTFYAPKGQYFRVTITGSAVAFVTG